MNYEEKINELSERIRVLEKAENKRAFKKKLKITYEIVKVLLILLVLVVIYVNINNKIVKPYKQKMNYVEEKVSTVDNFVHEKWDLIQKYIPFVK